jgi:cell division protein FtsB
MLATFFFPAYVAIKQRMRASRVEEQIKQHQRQLASVY